MSSLLPVIREERAAMSLCSICPEPGKCCKDFSLNIPFEPGLTPEAAKEKLSEWSDKHPREGDVSGFIPLRPVDADQQSILGKEFWWFDCLNLTPAGRCRIYERRPHVCRIYTPGNCSICAFEGIAGETYEQTHPVRKV